MNGKKIDNLILLKENNINVPDFITITYKEYEDKSYLDKINKLNNNKYAVRSSCSIEDSTTNSFAGQFDTYLNVNNKDIINKIDLCFKSLNNQNVKDYANKNNIDINDIKMNVIVQEMVDSKISGVLFTSNPSGIINESVIVVANGLGENVVDDKGKTTSYYYNTTDKIYYYEGKDILSKELIDKLIDISIQIKPLLGDYLDIEFGIDNNEIFILQARNITTINDDNLIVLDNSNIVESYPNLSLPLTCSFVNNIYTSIFKALVKRVLHNENDLKDLDKVLDNMTSNCNGRMYYQISNWYTLLKYIPFNNKIIPIWQDMMGVKIKSSDSNKTNTSILSRTSVGFNYLHEVFKAPKSMNKLNEEFNSIKSYYDKTYNNNLNNKELKKIYNTLENKVFNNWDITLINDMYAFIYTGLLKKHLKKKYPDTYEEITNNYISGISNIESLKPIKGMISLAYNKDKYSKEEYELKFKEYINLYGDRALEELKLESKTYRTNPELLEDKINEYLKDKDKLTSIYNDLNKEKINNLKENSYTRFLIKRVESGIGNREVSRLNRSRLFGMVRSIFISMGYNLYKDKIIDSKEDIFYLTLDEVFNIKENTNYKEIILNRKKDYEGYKLLPAYSRIIFTGNIFNKTVNNITLNKEYLNENELMGTPCSFGITEGEALVIDNINNIKDTKDKILITKMTDPGWVFLIAGSKGVISEKGSLLSHTAIISRELKVPSIVGVESLLKTIHTGDYIKMDASTGKITIIKRK